MSRRFIWILALCSIHVILGSCTGLEANASSANLSVEQRIAALEERLASLEENFTLAKRQLDVVLKRSATLYDRVDELEHKLAKMQNNITWLTNFAVPAAPTGFRVERIKKSGDGNYTVILRWRNGPEYMRITRFAIWNARKGETTYAGATYVNQTGRRIVKAELAGFAKGDEIVFKIFAKNDAGQSKPSYVEATIRPWAPVLMWRIKVLAGIAVLVIIVGISVRMGLKMLRRKRA